MTPGRDIVTYFGVDVIKKFQAAYLAKHGKTKGSNQRLIKWIADKPAEFLEMLCDYMDKEMA